MEKKIEMSTAFLEDNNILIYAVLSDFAKCCNSRLKSAPRVQKIDGGFSQLGQCPNLDFFIFKWLPLVSQSAISSESSKYHKSQTIRVHFQY